MVTQLKGYGIWTKLKAVYPFVGGTASSHKFNLKDPRDLDAAYRLVFNGGITHSSNGALFGGVNGYADTKLSPYVGLTSNNNHLSVYSNLNVTDVLGEYSLVAGALNSAYTQRFDLAVSSKDAFATPNTTFTTNADASTQISYVDPSKLGHYLSTRIANNNFKLFKNNSLVGSKTSTNTAQLPNYSIYIGGWNQANAARFSYRRLAFASIGDGLSDAEAANFYTAVQTFQTTLGRQVGVPIVADTDAQAFLNAAVITDSTQANAIDVLVTDLKSANIWTKMKAIYPFVGGTATQHKFNLKDPRDLDAAYRLVFNGGWTHSATGVLPNGTTAYADTKIAPSAMGQDSIHASFYSRTNTVGAFWDLGSYDAGGGVVIGVKFVANTTSVVYTNTKSADSSIDTNPTTGLYIASRTTNSTNYLYRNGALLVTGNKTSFAPINLNIYLAADNEGTPIGFSTRQQAFASIGDGLTDAEAVAFYTAVQKYQTSLGRQV